MVKGIIIKQTVGIEAQTRLGRGAGPYDSIADLNLLAEVLFSAQPDAVPREPDCMTFVEMVERIDSEGIGARVSTQRLGKVDVRADSQHRTADRHIGGGAEDIGPTASNLQFILKWCSVSFRGSV